jgi:hypothetical protein
MTGDGGVRLHVRRESVSKRVIGRRISAYRRNLRQNSLSPGPFDRDARDAGAIIAALERRFRRRRLAVSRLLNEPRA